MWDNDSILSNQNSCLREVRESHKVFSALVSSIEKSHKAVVAEIEERQSEEEKRVETLVKELEEEIKELRNEKPEPKSQQSDEQCDDKEYVPLVGILEYCLRRLYIIKCHQHSLQEVDTSGPQQFYK